MRDWHFPFPFPVDPAVEPAPAFELLALVKELLVLAMLKLVPCVRVCACAVRHPKFGALSAA